MSDFSKIIEKAHNEKKRRELYQWCIDLRERNKKLKKRIKKLKKKIRTLEGEITLKMRM